MLKKEKCVEYFFDSRNYDEEQILQSIEKEEKGFEKNKSEINIKLNDYGIYEVKLRFIDKRYEAYSLENKIYGQYKRTKTYQPI